MSDANIVFLSVDDDGTLMVARDPTPVKLDTHYFTARRNLQIGWGTDTDVFDLYYLATPCDPDNIVEQLGGRFNYDWKKWTKGTLETVIDYVPDPDEVHLVALLSREVVRLPPREYASELPGGNFFSKRKPNAPSSGAEPQNFAKGQEYQDTRIICDRPRDPNQVPIPIALLVASFGTFQTNVRTISPSDRAFEYAQKMSDRLCVFFDNELQREEAFRKLLGDFLGVVIDKEKLRSFDTDGAVVYHIPGSDGACLLVIKVKLEQCGNGDPSFQAALYYVENGRIVRDLAAANVSKAADFMRLRLPSILITHAGPNIQILGGVMVDRPQTEVLTASLPMSFHASNNDMLLDLARTLTALKLLFTDLGQLYKNPPAANPLSPVQHSFPYPRSFEDEKGTTISFTYLRRIDPTRLVFKIKTESKAILYVKYAREYGEAAHRKAHELGLAPKLLACTLLEGGWRMLVIEPIPEHFKALDVILEEVEAEARDSIKERVREALEPFFKVGYVHGDLRSVNIFYDVKEQKILVLDYDWAGLVGDVRYPPCVWTTADIWRPEAHLSLRPITLDHDRAMVDHLD